MRLEDSTANLLVQAGHCSTYSNLAKVRPLSRFNPALQDSNCLSHVQDWGVLDPWSANHVFCF